MTLNEYLLDNRAAAAERRFGALSALFDDVTFRHVEALGIRRGWRCWEVGAGGPSVPNWLAGRAGPDGHVLATDIDTSWIDGMAPHVEVRQHDIARDDLPSGVFDLIHARLVLCWIPERDKALRRMAGALRPGGWLLIEDFDPGLQSAAYIGAYLPDHDNANKLRAGFGALLAQRGADPAYGRKLPRLLTEQGLADVAADAYMPVSLPAVGTLDLSNFDQLHDALLAQGLATAEEIDDHRAAVDRGTGFASPPLISAWGRKPSLTSSNAGYRRKEHQAESGCWRGSLEERRGRQCIRARPCWSAVSSACQTTTDHSLRYDGGRSRRWTDFRP